MRAKAILLAADGCLEHGDRRAVGCLAPVGVDVAKTVLRGRAAGSRGETAAGSAAAFFPRRRWPRSRRWRASCPPRTGVPLSRWSSAELAREAVTRGIVATDLRRSTVWRWLPEDAIRPWNYRSWIFPRDPKFAREGRPDPRPLRGPLGGRAAASRRLRRLLRREALDPSPRAQAPSAARQPGGDGQQVEHEYERKGALCYLAAWDVRRAKLFDRCAPKDGIVPFDALVEQFMSRRALPHRPARVRDRRQRLRAPRPALDRPPPRRLAEPDPRAHPGPRQLAQPGRDLLLHRAAQGAAPPTTSPTSTRSSRRCSRSAAATSRSPSRSSGSSPATTSTSSSTASTSPHPNFSSPREPNPSTNLGRRPLSQGSGTGSRGRCVITTGAFTRASSWPAGPDTRVRASRGWICCPAMR